MAFLSFVLNFVEELHGKHVNQKNKMTSNIYTLSIYNEQKNKGFLSPSKSYKNSF